MKTKIIEASNGLNWGKFLIGEFDHEWMQQSVLETNEIAGLRLPLLVAVGWRSDTHRLVVDLQTGEGAIFPIGGLAQADLDKHRIWVCPLFEPFLAWLYRQDLRVLEALPDSVELPDAPFSMQGYRRAGPVDAE